MHELGAGHQVVAQDLHADLDRGLVALLPVLQESPLDHHFVVMIDQQRMSLNAHDPIAPVVEHGLAGKLDPGTDLHDAYPALRQRECEVVAV